jgi:hypothetical protein
MRQNAGLLSQHVSGTSMPIRSTIVSSVFGVQIWKKKNVSGEIWSTGVVCCSAHFSFQVWTPESGAHYCLPDAHTSARNMLRQ